LGKIALAERYFCQAAQIDLANNMGNAAGGVHTGAMGGLWQAAVLGFAGLRVPQERPALRSNLPPGWRSLSMRVQWRGQWHQLSLLNGVEHSRTERDTP
jgi:kojibiose phosphorylase